MIPPYDGLLTSASPHEQPISTRAGVVVVSISSKGVGSCSGPRHQLNNWFLLEPTVPLLLAYSLLATRIVGQISIHGRET